MPKKPKVFLAYDEMQRVGEKHKLTIDQWLAIAGMIQTNMTMSVVENKYGDNMAYQVVMTNDKADVKMCAKKEKK